MYLHFTGARIKLSLNIESFAMALHSSTLAWKIPWTEEPGRLKSMGSLGVGYDWATSLSLSRIGEGNGNPLQCSCLENPRDGGAWWAATSGVTQSWTRLKRLSSSSSLTFITPVFHMTWPLVVLWEYASWFGHEKVIGERGCLWCCFQLVHLQKWTFWPD